MFRIAHGGKGCFNRKRERKKMTNGERNKVDCGEPHPQVWNLGQGPQQTEQKKSNCVQGWVRFLMLSYQLQGASQSNSNQDFEVVGQASDQRQQLLGHAQPPNTALLCVRQ